MTVRTCQQELPPVKPGIHTAAGKVSSARCCGSRRNSSPLIASAQAKLNQKNAQTIAFPLPPLAEQHWIVSELAALQVEVDLLKRLQVEAAAELDALLPAPSTQNYD